MANGKDYIEKLKTAYEENGMGETWHSLMNIAHGITDEDREHLLRIYPEIPDSLLEILAVIDGTYHREYGEELVTEYFFGSDVSDGEYPYYLFSAADILESKDEAQDYEDMFYFFKEEFDEDFGPFIDERILMDASKLKWLKFSDCMNNGGTSSLYIDFTPSEKGRKGQIVRFLHDPDELAVIADSFDAFLEMIIGQDFRFLHEM